VLRGLTGLAIAVVVAACGGASPSSASPAPATRGSTVVARWVAEDGSIVVLNVVLSPGPNAPQPGALARRYQATYPSARVIIRFFDSTAGPERFVIGHVPRSGEPIPGVNAPATQIAIFDLPATDALEPAGDRVCCSLSRHPYRHIVG
jgi:hypothetical protein